MGTKLKGSDHVPVFTSFDDLPEIPEHSTPPLASRYLPMINGFQQTLGTRNFHIFSGVIDWFIFSSYSCLHLCCKFLHSIFTVTVSVFMKRRANVDAKAVVVSCSSSSQSNACGDISTGPLRDCGSIAISKEKSCSFENETTCSVTEADTVASRGSTDNLSEGICGSSVRSENISRDGNMKKVRKIQSSQLSLKSFFTTNPKVNNGGDKSSSYVSSSQNSQVESISEPNISSKEDSEPTTSTQEQDQSCSSAKQKNDVALMEWQRIQNQMQNSIPLCKGHKEACVARVVKKPGPTFGRRFYVCSRAEVKRDQNQVFLTVVIIC